MPAPRDDAGQVRAFLAARFGAVDELERLSGGFWSSAYAFRSGDRELVVRFGAHKDWFEAERAAVAFSSPALPVPEVVELGDALDGAYVVSVRHHGVNLEDVRPDQSDAAGPLLASLLGALFTVPKGPALPVDWHSPAPTSTLTWRGWLRSCLVDDPSREVHGWRSKLAADPVFDRLFDRGSARVLDLVDGCPERRDLVHGDLLHANVLVDEDASRPRAVFSWKCSVRGDFLFDAAWCTFCGAVWHPGIAAADPWGRLPEEPALRDHDAWADASLRHHCYELHIGLTAMSWNAWVDDEDQLRRVASHLEAVLERGPLPAVGAP